MRGNAYKVNLLEDELGPIHRSGFGGLICPEKRI